MALVNWIGNFIGLNDTSGGAPGIEDIVMELSGENIVTELTQEDIIVE
jgi:hypothetical protein